MELKKYKLSDVATIHNGATPSSMHPEYFDGDIVWLTPKDLSDQQSKYIYRGERNITQEAYNSCSTHLLPQGAILMSSRAPIGLLAIAGCSCCTNQGFKSLVVNNVNCDTEYLYYYLKHNISRIIGLGSGTTFQEVSKKSLETLEIELPIKIEQVRISKILADIDRKIALNREINRNLEAMARQLYDYWFVQFDFPDENGKPYKSSGGKMVWNEKIKREIPEGWDCMNIGNYAQCKGGYAFKSKDFGNEGLPVIKIGNIHEDYTLSMADCLKVTGLYNHQFTTNKYDLVIAMTGATIGKFAISPSKYWVNQRVGRFDLGDRPLERLGYLFNSLKQQYFRKQVFQIAGGCAQPNISNDQIDSILILKPTDILLDKYNKTCMPLLRLLIKNILEIELLIEKRDTLLPLLMNGQVSVMPSEVNCDLSHG